MKRAIASLFALVLFVGAHVQLSGQAADWKQVPIPKLPAFHPPQPKRVELPNGMVVFLQEDHELPLIDGVMRIRGGERDVPAGKAGLTDIYGEVWRTGGTKTQTGDQLDDFLEQRAAKVETGGGEDSTTISWSCLKEDFEDVFKVFLDVLENPEFRADKIEIAQKGMYDGISRRNDDPGQIARREAAKLAYGATNPYARVPEYTTVAAVTREDLVQWHKNHLFANDIIVGVVGDFDSAKMEARLRQAFASWPKGPAVKGAGDRVRSGQARVLPGGEDRHQPEQYPDGRAGYDPQQPGLLRPLGVQRGVRRRVLVAAVQPDPHRQGTRLRGRRRGGHGVGSSRDGADDGEHQKQEHGGIRSGAGSGNGGAGEPSDMTMGRSSRPRTAF